MAAIQGWSLSEFPLYCYKYGSCVKYVAIDIHLALVIHPFVSITQLLTQEEFQKIRVKQLSSQLAPKRGVKRQLQELLEQQEERREGNGELLPEAAIDTLDHIKRRTNKKAKVESIMVRNLRLALFI